MGHATIAFSLSCAVAAAHQCIIILSLLLRECGELHKGNKYVGLFLGLGRMQFVYYGC